MSVIDQLKKLDEQRAKLLGDAKAEAMEAAEKAVATLNELGFNYRLVSGETTTTRTPRAPREGGGTRRTGVREEVIRVIEEHPDGIGRAAILETMGAKGDKSAEQSISNALAALFKAGNVSRVDGNYKPK